MLGIVDRNWFCNGQNKKRSPIPSPFIQYNIYENLTNIYEYVYNIVVLVYKVQPNRWYWYEYQYWKEYQSSMA